MISPSNYYTPPMESVNVTSTTTVVSGSIHMVNETTRMPSLAPSPLLELIDVDAEALTLDDATDSIGEPTLRPSLRQTLQPTIPLSPAPTPRPTVPPLEQQLLGSSKEMQEIDPFVCSFCPSGQPLQAVAKSRTFVNVPDDNLNCGFWEDLFAQIESPEECNADILLAAFEGTFDPTIYCRCPAEAQATSSISSSFADTATMRCPLCPNLIHSANNPDDWVVDPNRIVNGVTCGDYADLAAAASTDDFCQSILNVYDIQNVCCGITPYPNNSNNGGGSGSRDYEEDSAAYFDGELQDAGSSSINGAVNSAKAEESSSSPTRIVFYDLKGWIAVVAAVVIMHNFN